MEFMIICKLWLCYTIKLRHPPPVCGSVFFKLALRCMNQSRVPSLNMSFFKLALRCMTPFSVFSLNVLCLISTGLLHLLSKDCSVCSTGTVVITVDMRMRCTVGYVLLDMCIMYRTTVMVQRISACSPIWILILSGREGNYYFVLLSLGVEPGPPEWTETVLITTVSLSVVHVCHM